MNINQQRRRLRRAGFTLLEVLIASSLGILVLAGTLSAYIWALRTACESRQYAWAQTEATVSASKLTHYIRNARTIDRIATNGNWVQLVMSGGITSKFSYVNSLETDGDGKLLFQPDISDPSSVTNIVAKGVSKVMTQPKTRNIFMKGTNSFYSNSVHIAYRITEPLTPGECPAEVDIGVRLRNY